MTLQLPATFTSTHETGGLPGYPAVDVFANPGTPVRSPADGVVTKLSGQAGGPGGGGPYGYSIYIKGDRGTYFLTHFGSRNVQLGQRVRRGQVIGTVVDYPDRADHIHEGFHAGPGGPTTTATPTSSAGATPSTGAAPATGDAFMTTEKKSQALYALLWLSALIGGAALTMYGASRATGIRNPLSAIRKAPGVPG